MTRMLTLFEDDRVPNLHPLTYTRHVSDLVCGGGSLGERIALAYGPQQPVAAWCRGILAPVLAEEHPELEVNQVYPKFLMLNGRLLAPGNLSELIPPEGADRAWVCRGALVALRLSGTHAEKLRYDQPFSVESIPDGVPVETLDVVLIDYPWDLINHHARMMEEEPLDTPRGGGRPDPGAHVLAPDHVFVDPTARVMAGAVLNGESGCIRIGPGARVMPHAYLEGPLVIGEKSLIKAGAKIYGHTYIGPVSKVGGEVEASIIHGFTNKQHDGFLGHSYLGEWVNLGADTNNSDLKNNYSPVRVTLPGGEIETGCQFLGSIIGDHTKTAIGTLLNTGSIIGVGCNIFGAGFPPKYVPSFSWGGGQGLSEYAFEKFLPTAERVLARRGRRLSPAMANLLRRVFETTAAERRKEWDR